MKKTLFNSFQGICFVIVAFGLLPLGYIAHHYYEKKNNLKDLQEQIEQAIDLAATKQQKQALNLVIRQEFANADSLFLETHLASLSLLNPEKTSLKTFLQSPASWANDCLAQRYQFLQSGQNRLILQEVSTESGDGIHETTLSLAHPVQVDKNDLTSILSLIEGKHPLQPQLFFTEFHLDRKVLPSQSEVYELQMKILKREFSS